VFAVSVGRQRLQQGDLKGAVAQLQDAVTLDPSNARAHYELSKALRKIGDVAAARRHLDEARRLDAHIVPQAP